MDPRPVKRCLCYDRSFLEIQREGLKSIDEIIDRYGCTTGCGMCKPYIEEMLRTGETSFPVLEEQKIR